MKRLLILGAGGFGHMIQETALMLGYEEAVFLDDAVRDKDVVGEMMLLRELSGEIRHGGSGSWR